MPKRLPVSQLPPLQRATLLMMALLQESLSQSKWLDIVRLTGVKNAKGKALTFADVKEAIQDLAQQGWLAQTPGSGYFVDLRYDLGRKFEAFAYLLQHENKTAWLQLVRDWINKTYGRQWYLHQRAYYRREIWLALLSGQFSVLSELEDQYVRAQGDSGRFPLTFLADAADGMVVFQYLSPTCQAAVLAHSLQMAVYRLPDCPHLYGYVQALFIAGDLDPQLHELYGWHLLQQGELSQLHEFLAGHADEITVFDALLPLLQGDAPTALQQFQVFGNVQKRRSGKRKIYFPLMSGWFYLLALLSRRQPDDFALLEQQINAGRKAQDGVCYGPLSWLQEQLQSPAARLGSEIQRLFEPSHIPQNFDGLLCALALYWLDGLPERLAPDLLMRQRSWLYDAGYQWVAAELDALLEAAFQQPRLWPDWHQLHQLQPLCQLLQREEPWQQALQALQLLNTPSVATEKSSNDNSRLCWMLLQHQHFLSVEPREQKRNSKGVWSDGRAVALKRLVKDPQSVPALTAQDKAVIALIDVSYQDYYGSTSYTLEVDQALPALIGHPLVFWQQAPQIPVHVKQAEFYLQLRKLQGKFQLTLQPEEMTRVSRCWQQESPTSLLVYQKTEQVSKIQEILGKGLVVPAAGKTQLLQTISRLAGQLPVQSDLAELSPAIDTVAPDLCLYGHLLPWQQGLRFQLLVRPLAEGPWFKPGKGSAQLVGEAAGKPVQTQRVLVQEQQQYDRVIEACPALLEAEFDGSQWLLQQPIQCLELLEQLHQHSSDVLQLVWPEGEKFRIRRQARLQDLQLNIRQQGQWLTLDGELPLDADKVLTLKELLSLVSTSHGRFIALGEHEYLALTDSFRQQLAELNQLPGKNVADGLQLSPLTAPLIADLAAGAGQVTSNKAWQTQLARLNQLDEVQPAVPSTLQAELRDYQQQGFIWLARLAHWGVGACLADDMGLGKTVQTLALLLHRAARGPALVVAPLSVANNWRSEAARFAPTLQIRWYHETRDLTALGPFDLVICSYGLLQSDIEQFATQHWHSVVLDEAQAIKNAETKRAKAVMQLQADFRLIASGTPVENHLGELWSLFQFINPGLLGSKEQFSTRFASPIEQGDHSARLLLKKLLQPFILRRTKTQVLSELPPRTEIQLDVELSSEEMHLYEALRQQAIDKLATLEAGQSMQVLAEITRLRRFCCHPSLVLPEQQLAGSKLAVFADTLTELLDNKHKVLVFSQFVDHLAIVRRYLDEQQVSYQYLDGSTSVTERKKRVDAFQAGQGEVFLISLKAGGSGLNLTAADYVIHLDPWWNPAVEDQASDRAHRIGQARPVTIYRLVTQHTIEQKILALHSQKRELADSLLEGGDIVARLDAAQLLALMRS